MKKSFTKLTADSRYKLLSILSQTFKDPKSELNFEDPFELLCAVVLSAQATDKSVNKVTPTLFKVAKTPYQLKDLPVEELEGIIKSIGLYKNKAKNLIALAKMLCDNFGGVVPSNYDDLIKQTTNGKLQEILKKADILIDGPYIQSQRDITLSMRGSKNQSIINLKEINK